MLGWPKQQFGNIFCIPIFVFCWLYQHIYLVSYCTLEWVVWHGKIKLWDIEQVRVSFLWEISCWFQIWSQIGEKIPSSYRGLRFKKGNGKLKICNVKFGQYCRMVEKHVKRWKLIKIRPLNNTPPITIQKWCYFFDFLPFRGHLGCF